MEKLYKTLFSFLILCLPASQLLSQSLTGKITDQSGAVLPGISLHIQGLTSTVTNATGEYYFKLPSKGSYRLKISSAAFESKSKDVFVTNSSKVSDFVLNPLGTVADKKSLTGSRTVNPRGNNET